MELDEIIKELSVVGKDMPLPREALAEAARQKEAITPVLINSLNTVYDKICSGEEDVTEDPAYELSFYALFLLAQFREESAFPKLLQILKLDSDNLELILGDIVTNMGDILYSTYNGDLEGVKAVIADSSLDPFARGAALDVLDGLLRDGRLAREELVNFLRERLAALEDGESESVFGGMMVSFVADNDLYELVGDVREAFRQEKIDLMQLGNFDDFFDCLYNEREHANHVKIIADTAQELSGWACFKDETPSEPSIKEILSWKVGRNDPCPCGSGKKFKKCCLPKQEKLKAGHHIDFDYNYNYDRYPPVNRENGRPGLSEFYSEDSIRVDKLAYQAMRKVRHPSRQERMERSKTRREACKLLWSAFEEFRNVCAREGLETPEAYDRDHKMHYFCSEWLELLRDLMEKASDERYHEVESVLCKKHADTD